MTPVHVVRRLGSDEIPLARQTLRLMADVFDEPSSELSDTYVSALLRRPDF